LFRQINIQILSYFEVKLTVPSTLKQGLIEQTSGQAKYSTTIFPISNIKIKEVDKKGEVFFNFLSGITCRIH